MFWAIMLKYSLIAVMVILLTGNSAQAFGLSPVISHVKTGETGFASNEFVAIYNNSESSINVTNWCIAYSPASDASTSTLACLQSGKTDINLVLAPFSYARFSSTEFKNSIPSFIPDALFAAGISGTSGHVRLYDAGKNELDRLGWGAALNPEGVAVPSHGSGFVFQRSGVANSLFLQDSNHNKTDFSSALLVTIPSSGVVEEQIIIDSCPNIDNVQQALPDDYFLDSAGNCTQDQCDNIAGLQSTVPLGYESMDGTNCTEHVLNLESAILQITELLPNTSSTDTGNEFIEIYNPNDRAIDLSGYKLQLGPLYSKSYALQDQILQPSSYASFSDTLTGLVLPNSSSSVRLLAPNGDVVSETDTYYSPKDDEAWSSINGLWQFTNQPTPGSTNVSSLGIASTIGNSSEELEPCEVGKYRNPETNRCKTIESSDEELQACKLGQARNIETNRCRSLLAGADSLVPCKEGQERNSETNRCRTIALNASALVPCDAGEERNAETNRCRKTSVLGDNTVASVQDIPASNFRSFNWWILGGLLAGVASYGVYEWRRELARAFAKIRFKP